MEIMGIPLCSANPAMLRHCWSQNLGLVETWGIRWGDLRSRFMFKGPKVSSSSSSSVCPAPFFLRSSLVFKYSQEPTGMFWEQFIADDRVPLGFLFHGRLPCRMMQHSHVSLWWVWLHFVAASPDMHGWLENVGQNWVPTIEWFDDEKRWKKVSNCEAKGPFWSFWNIPTLLDSWCCTATFSQSQLQKVDTSNRPQFYSTKVSTTEQSRPWNWDLMRQIACACLCWCAMHHEWFTKQNRTMTINWWFQHVSALSWLLSLISY